MLILITGAASGLGWAMAQRWHHQGNTLILVDRDQPLLAQRTKALGERAEGICIDISDSEAIKDLSQQIQDRHGRLDLLVNNAGITHRSKARETDPAVLRQVMAVDWQGPVELTQALLPLLEKNQGSIVCLGSMAGWMPVPGRAGYCAAKAALSQYFEVLRLELEAVGVHVLMVYPSFVDTPIEQNALGADGQRARHPRSVIGTPTNADDLAEDIDHALREQKRWLFPHRLTGVGSLLWRITPRLYQRLIRRKFASEL